MNQQNTCKEEETPKVIPHKEASTAKEENRRDQPQDFRDQLIREGVPLDPLKKQIKEVADDFAGQNRIKLAFSQSKIGSTVSNFRERAMESLPIVDKTGILYKLLVENKNNSAFVIGPRRFGKSMAAQTVKAIFRNGWEWWTSHCTELSIVKDYNYKFPIHPVLYLDFSALTTPKSLVKDIFDSLRDLIEDNDLKESFAADIKIFEDDKSIDNMLSIFKRAIRTIAKKHTRGVVIIIDEYDYPLVSAAEELLFRSGSNPNPKDIHLDEETQETRNCMKKIFEAIKILRQDTDLGPTFEGSGTIVRFFYLTGIVPLNQISLFSGPNDVYDVRANPDYAEILGYREEDIKKVFKEVLDSIAKKELQLHSPLSELTNIRIEGMKKEIMDDIRKTYNGFRFNFEREETLYNPFCINYLLDNWNFNAVDKYPGYFSKSGSSKLIWIAVKHMPIMEKIKFYQDLMGNKNIEAVYTCRKEELLDKQSLQSLFTDPAKLGFFSGFFTIEKKGSTGSTWNLKIVNNEMRKHLCQEIDSKLKLSASFEKMIVSLEKDDIPTFFELYNDKLKNMSAFSNPSEQQYEDNEEFEGYGHTLFILLLDRFQHFIETTAKQKGINSLKFISNRSVDSSNKRFDCWISFEKHNNVNIYGFEIEFKCKKNLDDGLNEAYTDLVAKFSDTIEKTKGKNVHLKTAQTTYIACAIGFGVIQGLDIYKRTKQGDKEVLQKVRRWCPKVNVLVAERNKTSGLANIF